jgi:hypothetical protein
VLMIDWRAALAAVTPEVCKGFAFYVTANIGVCVHAYGVWVSQVALQYVLEGR